MIAADHFPLMGVDVIWTNNQIESQKEVRKIKQKISDKKND